MALDGHSLAKCEALEHCALAEGASGDGGVERRGGEVERHRA
jgi:hypothetical protein